MGIGTGLVIDDHGHILTNAHVVYDAAEIAVSLDSGDLMEAEIVGIDAISDLAVVRLTNRAPLTTKARFGSVEDLDVGQDVLALGYPLGLEKTATRGIISGVGRVLPLSPMSWLTPMVQTDAAISPGNSGGPLVNLCGEVIGINTLIATHGQNINFAVPIDIVLELLPQLLEQGRVIRPWHGIHGRMVPTALTQLLGIAPGFMIETVEPGSPADKIGLRGGILPVSIGADEFLLGGDVISSVNGEDLMDMDTVVGIVRGMTVGDRISIEYWRDGDLKSASVTLPERPDLPGDGQRFRQSR